MLNLIGQLMVGLLIGGVARFLLPGREDILGGMTGWLITALIGMAGAYVGTLIGRVFWKEAGYSAGWLMSIFGAVMLLVIYRMLV